LVTQLARDDQSNAIIAPKIASKTNYKGICHLTSKLGAL